MSIGRALIRILVLAASACVFAQTTQTKPPDVGTSGAASSRLPDSSPLDPCRNEGKEAGVAILSDTMGVDFAPYIARIAPIVQRNWVALIRGLVDRPFSKLGKVSIELLILKDGRVDIDGITIQASSGDATLDRAARGSIIRSDPFPRLPKEFPGENLRLRFSFLYNLSPDVGISPCVDVRVFAGSTLQFSASGKGISNASVMWSVSGPGCSDSACGTISDDGLYRAPLNIPVPPVVSVRAVPRSGKGVEARSKITIVQANPSH
jgi:hypothetical protein